MSSVGLVCSTSAVGGNTAGYTHLTSYNPVDSNGTLVSWCVRMQGAGNARLKIFRDDGTNYIYIGSSGLLAVNIGLNTGLSCNIPVLTGDIIAVYIDTNSVSSNVNVGGNAKYYSGDILSNSLKSSWGDNSTNIPIVYSTSIITDVYVDINKADDTGTGLSFATAKKTMKAGWDILNSAGTMHVASGDYSAQATIAYNKSWNLSPEDPNTTGAKNVKIPKST